MKSRRSFQVRKTKTHRLPASSTAPENPNDLYLNTELFYIMSSCFDQVLCPFL